MCVLNYLMPDHCEMFWHFSYLWFMKITSISSRAFYTFYRDHIKSKRRSKKNSIKGRQKVLDLQATIWETVAEHYLENQAGVYIDNIGYLCHMIKPERDLSISPFVNEIKYINSNGYKYRHLALELSDKKRYFHLFLNTNLIGKSKAKIAKRTRYRFLYNEVMAKKHAIKDKIIRKVYDKSKLKCKLKTFL